MKKRIGVLLLAVALIATLWGCGPNGSSGSAAGNVADPTVVTVSAATGKVVVRRYFGSSVTTAQAAQMMRGGGLITTPTATIGDVIEKRKTSVVSADILVYFQGSILVLSKTYQLVDGWLEAEIDLPEGTYWLYLVCHDAADNETFYGYSDVTIVAGQTGEAEVHLQMCVIPVKFAIANIGGTFVRSDPDHVGVFYEVSIAVKTAASDDTPYYSYDQSAVDSEGTLHFTAKLLVFPDMPAKLFVSVIDGTGTTIEQSLDIDGATLLTAICNEQEIIYIFRGNGTANITVTFPGE